MNSTKIPPYLIRHAQRYFDWRQSEPERAQNCLERAANYLDIWEFNQPWTAEIEAKIIQVLSDIQRRKGERE